MISKKGLELIKSFEGLRLKPYYCSAGKLTIGYGHVIRKGENYPHEKAITEAEAENLLVKDVKHAEAVVDRLVW